MAATNANVNPNDNKKVKVCMGHSRPVPHIAISYPVDDSYWFVSSCLDGKPMLRNGETGDWVGTFEGHKGAVWQTSFNREATRIVTGSGDFSAKVWDALSGADLHTWHMPHTVKCVDWSDDDAIIATGCMDKNVRIYDVTRYDAAPNVLPSPHPQGLRGVSVTPDGTGLIAACTEVVRKWDTRTWTVTQSIEIEGISGIEYNKYNNTYVVAGKGAVTLLNPNDLSVIRKYDMNEDADAAAISPDGNLIVVGAKLRVKEYDAKTGAELFLHRGHHGPVFSVRYAPDSQTYASGSEDGFVRIWPSAHVLRTPNESTATPTTGYDQQF